MYKDTTPQRCVFLFLSLNFKAAFRDGRKKKKDRNKNNKEKY